MLPDDINIIVITILNVIGLYSNFTVKGQK